MLTDREKHALEKGDEKFYDWEKSSMREKNLRNIQSDRKVGCQIFVLSNISCPLLTSNINFSDH